MPKHLNACRVCGSGCFQRHCRQCVREGLHLIPDNALPVGSVLEEIKRRRGYVAPKPDPVFLAQQLAHSWGVRARV